MDEAPDRIWIDPYYLDPELPGHVEYARADTLPAVRWAPGAPPEDMRGRYLMIWQKSAETWYKARWQEPWMVPASPQDGYWSDGDEEIPEADILAWADPQPPEGV